MGGRMTVTLNTNGDVCAIQKAGGDGVLQSVIMQCLRIASVKAGDMTSKIKNAVSCKIITLLYVARSMPSTYLHSTHRWVFSSA